MNQQKHHCVPEVSGTCLALGESHITTFDQVWTGIYGVGTYTLVKGLQFYHLGQTKVKAQRVSNFKF